MKYFLLFFTSVYGFSACTSDTQKVAIPYSATPVTEARIFAPDLISTKENSEFYIHFSPDGLTAYFSRRAPEEKQKIYASTFEEGQWSVPELQAFSTDRDETPFITSDGKRFFFGSERPIPGKPNLGNFDMNVWVMEKETTGWGEPTPLPEPINEVQQAGEEWPSSNNNLFNSIDDRTFYFTTMKRGEKAIQLYTTEWDGRQFSTPEKITGLFEDPKYWINSATLSPNGKFLVFNSFGIPDAGGGEDIFVSHKTDKGWSLAKPVGNKVNTEHEEGSPSFSRDGRYFFFTRTEKISADTYGESDIYFIETDALQLEALFKK